jgi:hypothetical protein
MVKHWAYKLVYLSFLLSIFSCSTSTVEPDAARLGYDYFPLEAGSFAVYEVEETVYSLTSAPVSKTFQVKEAVVEEFTDLSNEKAYKLMRYNRQNATADWNLDSVWVAKRTVNQAIRTENNVSFVKLVFPIKENQQWNGNALNNLGSDDYQLSKVNKAFQVNNEDFASTATVTQVNDSSACNMKRVYEVYADKVGLVYKEKILVEYRQINNICEGLGNIQAGIKSYQRLIQYGKE